MEGLRPVRRLTVRVLVDNATDPISPGADCTTAAPGPGAAACCCCSYTSEASRRVADVRSGAAPCIDWGSTCLAGHGLCLLLEVEAGPQQGEQQQQQQQHQQQQQQQGTEPPCGATAGAAGSGGGGGGLERHSLLFDAGPSGELLLSNIRRWGPGLDLSRVGALVLSHWHVDHSGGLPAAVDAIGIARSCAKSDGSSEGVPGRVALDVHPRRPWCRGLRPKPGDDVIPFNQDPDPAAVAAAHAGWLDVVQHDAPHTLLGSCFGVSGYIPRVTPYETGNPQHASQWVEGGPWEDDPDIADERALVVDVEGKGPVVFSACSHAGIVNVARWVQAALGRPPYAIFGGLHLAPRDCLSRIAPTARDLAELSPALVAAGHCTGWRAQAALQEALPGRCMPLSVGAMFELAAGGGGGVM